MKILFLIIILIGCTNTFEEETIECGGCDFKDSKIKTIQLRTGENELKFGDDGIFIIVPAQGGNTINILRNGVVGKLTILQISPDAQETVIMVYSDNIALEGNINWEMTNGDVLVLGFLASEKAIELSRVNR